MTVRHVEFDSYASSLGISFVPLDRESKSPYHAEWTNPDRTFLLNTFKPDDNIGGRWGITSKDLIDVDCDTSFACLIGDHLISHGPRWGHLSKQRSHYVLHCPGVKTEQFIDPITKKVIVEIRSTGSQSALPGSIHPSGEPYTWERQEDPPTLDAQALRRLVSTIAAAAFVASLWKDARHKFALRLAGFLAKNQMPQEQAKLFVELVTIGAEDIKEQKNRLDAVRDTYEDFANGKDLTASFHDILGEDHATLVAKTLATWLGLERSQFQIHGEMELLKREPTPFLVKGLLVQRSLIVLVAPPDIGKTFLSLDLALSVAAAEPTWLGHRLLQYGPVLYVMGEGLGRFQLRYTAWKQVHGITRLLPFYWIDQPVPLLDEKAMQAFRQQVGPLKLSLIIFDTLSRCFIGGDENSTEDMGKAMAACDDLRARTKATILLPHHTRKDGLVERGSTVLRASSDTVLTLTEDEDEPGLLTFKCDRQKDAERFAQMELRRTIIQLDGVWDEEGNPETSCVIQLATEGDQQRLTGDQKREKRILDFVTKHPDCTKDAVCKQLGGRRGDVLDAIKLLIADGRVVVSQKDKRLSAASLFDVTGVARND